MRAGLVFVLLSVAAGTAFRAWQRAHTERFDEIVASLVDARDRDEAAAGAARTVGAENRSAPGTDSTATEAAAPSNGVRTRRKAPAPLQSSIDVDRATEAELERLPGIGPGLAGRIVADRARRGSFGGPDGLRRVRGIGPKTLEKIRPYLAP